MRLVKRVGRSIVASSAPLTQASIPSALVGYTHECEPRPGSFEREACVYSGRRGSLRNGLGSLRIGYRYDPTKPLCSVSYTLPALIDMASPKPGDRVLDVGCGVGAPAEAFESHGCSYVGVDLNADRIATARERNARARFEVLPAKPGLIDELAESPFDIVISSEVIEHVFSPVEFVTAVREALKAHGRFVLTTPYHGYLKNVLLAVAGKWDSHHTPWIEYGHIKFWSRASLTDFLESHGFDDVRFRGAGRVPWLWKSMVLSARRL